MATARWFVMLASCAFLRAADHIESNVSCGGADQVSCARRLMANQEWQAIVDVFPPSPQYPAEVDFCRGMALAGLGRWPESREALESGWKKSPSDKRFPLELAGIAFKLGDFSESGRQLKRALRVDPGSAYGNDFLASLYFLQGNLAAALKYWNRVEKPRVEFIRTDPGPGISPVVLDRAFAFSPGSFLTLRELRCTQASLGLMDVLQSYRFELAPRGDGSFDLRFDSVERDGWGGSAGRKLLSLLREIPYQTVHLDLLDIGGRAANLESSYRWDAQRRRVFAAYSRPLNGDPQWRYQLWLDGRDENWDIRGTSPTAAPTLFKLRKLEMGASIAAVINGRWEWNAGISVGQRQFDQPSGDVTPSAFFRSAGERSWPVPIARVPALVCQGPGGAGVDCPRSSNPLFGGGFSLNYEAGVRHLLIDIPERRFQARLRAGVGLSNVMTGSSDPYVKLDWGLGWDWQPQATGDDYHLSGQLRTGKMLGLPPADDLYSLGIERDNDLYLRGHPGTVDGMKGNGPLGRSFILLNCELDKIVHDGGLMKLSLGPFLDSGRTYGSPVGLAPKEWLWDVGVQSKVVIMHDLTVAFSYGWDLRSGDATFYSGLRGLNH